MAGEETFVTNVNVIQVVFTARATSPMNVTVTLAGVAFTAIWVSVAKSNLPLSNLPITPCLTSPCTLPRLTCPIVPRLTNPCTLPPSNLPY